jgi:hypothetical protein
MDISLVQAWVVVLRSKLRCVAFIGAIGGVFLAMAQPQALAQRFFYRFTPIVDTKQGFPISYLQQPYPCQNSQNLVAFEAALGYTNDGSSNDIFTSFDVGAIQSIADSTSMGYTYFGNDCSMNANGLVLFPAYQKNASSLLLGEAGTSVKTLLSINGTDSGISRFQLNSQNKAVVLEDSSEESGGLVLTKVAGGSENTIAVTSPGSPFKAIGSVSINSAGTVAFSAERPDGSEGIFTVSENGITQVLADSNSGPIGYFGDVALNDKGSVAVDGADQNNTPGVWRVDSTGGGYPPVVTKITDANTVGAIDFDGVSINSSGEVAYSFLDGNQNSNIGFGNGGISLLSPIVVQPYSYVLGRFVAEAFISQDSLNDLNQIVMSIVFMDGSSVIALAQGVDAVSNPRPPLPPVKEFGLSTGTGSSAGVHTSVNLPPQLLQLTFNATFITEQGELKVTLGDKVLKTVPASARGVRQTIRIPIDLRLKHRPTAAPLPQELKFQLTAKPRAVVQIGNIRIPEAGLRWNPRQKNSRWHFDTQGGGWGGLVDATRFPVEIKVLSQEPRETSASAHASVAILSTKSFDATKDIERDTLHFAAMPVRRKRDAKGSEHAQCAERDVNGGGHPDLVCEFETPITPTGSSAQRRIQRLEAMTPYGWIVEGQAE